MDLTLNALLKLTYEWEINQSGFPVIYVTDPDGLEFGYPGFPLDFTTIDDAMDDDLEGAEEEDLTEWLDLADSLTKLASHIRNRIPEFYHVCD